MIEHVKFITREATFNVAFSGKYSYLIGKSGTGKSYMSGLLYQVENGYVATIEGDKHLVGGNWGVALDHLDDKDAVLLFGEDFDVPTIMQFWSLFEESKNQFIFMTRDIIPKVPYLKENVFTMQRTGEHEFTMLPYLVRCEL